jgi:hypothetical protein
VSSSIRKHYDNYKHNNNNNNNNNNNCPASSLIKFHVDGYFNYPIDLFYPKYFSYLKQLLNNTTVSINNYNNSNNYDDLYKLTTTIITHDNDNIVVYNCSKPNFDEDLKFYPYHLCLINSNHRLLYCPLIIDNIIDATSFINNNDHHHHSKSSYDINDSDINNNNNNNTTLTSTITTTNSSSSCSSNTSSSNSSSTSKHQHHQNPLHVSKS